MLPRSALGPLLSCALAPGCLPLATPPLRADVGAAKRLEADQPFLRASIGAHAASLALSPDLPVDAGAGYVAYTRARGTGASRVSETVQGAYAEASTRVVGGDYWRVFAGGRGEVLFPELAGERTGYSVLGRASAELMLPVEFQPVAGVSSKGAYLGVAYGMIGVGAYLESGIQQLPSGVSSGIVGGGLTLRVPATVGIFCCLWPKK
jgi:hypothetical protein